MEHFDNPNPFASDDARDSGPGNVVPENNNSGDKELLSPVSPTDDRTPSQNSRTLNDDELLHPPSPTEERTSSSSSKPRSLSKQRTKSDHGDDNMDKHHTIDKLKSAAEDVQAGVVDKVRTVRHRLHMDSMHAYGVSRFLNPTNIQMRVRYQSDSDENASRAEERELIWRARDNRKGRNSIAVPRLDLDSDDDDHSFLPLQFTPRMSSSLKHIRTNLWKMISTFPYWDMAFWSGWSYTIGSALFICDGVLAWYPVAHGEDSMSETAKTYAGPLSFFFGAIFYQIGAVAPYLEAVNDGSFHGSAMRRLLDGHDDDNKKLLDEKIHDFFSHLNPAHRHREEGYTATVDPEAGWKTKEARHLRPGSIYPDGKLPAPRRGAVDMGGEEGDTSIYMSWRWWPTWHALRTHHVYEIGYLACAIQLFGVTLYGVTAIVVLPGILDSLEWWQELGAYWYPQVVAAACFLIASLMFMLETQEKWYKPEPQVLGWWVGAWATVGSVGFELIAIFGILSHTRGWAEYQSDLSTIWGSSAYFMCSALQWYEAVNKNPIEELFNEPGEMKSSQVHPI
ncbi:hypothetical protein HII31_08082 [Pseudocercospora fuligena]|uniref:Integral membrane protein n=1 Tax=Pseudocercospora fuligena TaxID=685502 RepID=A0A8H6RGX5_9PEZI|nr:hypothetical protein HII31_08082 [Pseudocercospora fuligena]